METQQGWDFNCPQYVDFSMADSLAADDKADTWFGMWFKNKKNATKPAASDFVSADYDHENGVPIVDSDEQLSSGPAVQRVTRSQAATSPSTPNRGKPQTPQRTRSKTPKGMKENITPAVNGVTQLEKTPVPNDSNKAEGPQKAEMDRVKQEKVTPKPEDTEVLKDVSASHRVTRSVARTPQATVEEKTESKAPIKNICTSLEEWKKITAPKQATSQGSEPERINKTRQAEINPNNKRQHRSMDKTEIKPKKTKPEETERGRTPNKTLGKQGTCGLKRSTSFNVKPRSVEAGSRHVRGYSGERPQRLRTGSASSDRLDKKTPNKSEARPTVTIATTPTLMKRKPKLINQPAVKNSEQLEMEKIAYFRQELAKKKKQAEESYKAAMSSKGPSVMAQPRPVTHPQGFHFETDSRVKTHQMETRQDGEVKDFVGNLRTERHKSPGPSGSRAKNQSTKPQPFNFTNTKRRKLGDLDEKQAEKYESMAEKLKAFNATPDRFRSRPREKGPQPRGRSRSPHDVTIPKTPQFETRSRARPVTAPTREELENKELEECQKHQFKARPVNTKILTNPNTGITKVPKKPTTKPEEFHLSSNQRTHNREREQEEKHEFHAQPLNKKILEGIVGLQEAKKIPVTVPESPAFALKHRARIPVEVPKQDEGPSRTSRTVPHYGIPFQPQLQPKYTEPEPFTFEERERARAAKKLQKIEEAYEKEKLEEEHVIKASLPPHVGVPFRPRLSRKTTTVEPFTFDERDRLRLEKKEQKINEIIAEENKAREFHAAPLPDLDTVLLPPKKTKPITAPEPFNLDTDLRGSKKAEEWSQKMEDELRHQKEQMRFKAQSSRVLEQEPFIPLKEHKSTTDISEFELSTAKRAVKREAFEMIKKAKEDEKYDIERQEMLRREAEEQEEYERQRREAVHKAMPIKQYKPVHVQRSNKPLTAPMTPEFKTDTRLRTRAQHSDSIAK